jgi:gliding motility-associated-like protein
MCGTPIDTVRPCAPTLTVLPPCSSYVSYETILKWVPKNTCGNDVVKYRIYYKKLSSDPFILLDSVTNTIFEYVDKRYDLKTSIAGCYAVLGVDSFSNESFFTNTICIDNCPEYIIPNVFTPNSDNVNDTLHPFPYRFVEKIDLIIYNRWGSQVYNTTNMDINWTGKDISTGNDCSEGVYYYLCDVYERFLSGTKKRTLRGTIQIIR